MKNKSELTVVCDAGPIIHLDELDCLDLLSDFRQVLCVFSELREKSTLYVKHTLLDEIILKVKNEFGL